MQKTDVLLGLLRERGKRGLPLQRIYRQRYNPYLYLTAYGRIYRNDGAMTAGTTEETVDAMSLEKIKAILDAVRHERYQWQPARRTYIAKKNGKKRPWGLPTWSDKLLAEVMRMILDAYFDSMFSTHSHGFRSGKGCHTALQEIYHNRTLSGVPQGSILSPLLSNLLLDKLDQLVETHLIPRYTKGQTRKYNPVYIRLRNRAAQWRKRGHSKEAQQLKKQAQELPSQDPNDPDYRGLKYVRSADDFCLAFLGPYEEAKAIKQQLQVFLREELKLDLSEEKTLITHARSQAAKFLGYEITTLHSKDKQSPHRGGHKRRSINGHIGLKVPRKVLEENCLRDLRKGKPIHRAELLNESDFTIIATYQLEYRGLVNYSQMAYNLHTLSKLKWMMEASLTKTLAYQHKCSVKKVYGKYPVDLDIDGKTYKGLQVTVPREGKKPLVATWGGIPLTWDIRTPIKDASQQPPWNGRTELEKRLLAQTCEQGGVTSKTTNIEVHPIRALKDLEKYTGREKPLWVKIMAARRRKTLVLCQKCHDDLHAGRPHPSKVSRSRTVLRC
jgi:hypothetical protein